MAKRAKEVFSNSSSAIVQKWGDFLSGDVKRQAWLETALAWAAGGRDNIGGYLGEHRFDGDVSPLKSYFTSVLDWADGLLERIDPRATKGLDWARLYEAHHCRPYSPHVAAWSKGGATDISNCQMLCRTHNRAKGNR